MELWFPIIVLYGNLSYPCIYSISSKATEKKIVNDDKYIFRVDFHCMGGMYCLGNYW
jgi:hypothetical protein